jgi:hypothetical protein
VIGGCDFDNKNYSKLSQNYEGDFLKDNYKKER